VKRVLFVAYLFPPIANSGTQRPLKFAKYLENYGWQPTVVTAAGFNGHSIDPTLLAEIPSHIEVVRVPMLNDLIGDRLSSLLGGGAIGHRVGDAVRWRIQARYRSPDMFACWRRTAFRAALRIYRDSGFDAIYATGFPWTSLLIGRDVAKATGRPLIADFRDPWAGDDLWRSNSLEPERVAQLERSVVAQASAVVTVSPAMTRMMKAANPEAEQSKFVTIHNGFDPLDVVTPTPKRSDKFRIVFTGVWKDGYNPSRLYDALDALLKASPHVLRNTEVMMAGFAPGEAARRGLDSLVSELGRLSHKDAVALMSSADILFFATADGTYQELALPGKMYEYLATGRPVIALTHPDGDAARVLARVGGAIVIAPEDSERVQNVISTACVAGRLDVPPHDRDALAAFERSNLTKRLASVLDAVTSGAPPPPDSAWLPQQVSAAGRPV
jgi:glycosyltransferase involved in cell wall biosynthesis